MALNILLEASPLENGVPTTKRMSLKGVTPPGVYVDGTEWLPVITAVPEPSASIMDDGGGALSPMAISMGSVSFAIGKRNGNGDWNKLNWVSAPVAMWVGEVGKPFSTYKQWFTGTLSGLARTGGTAELALRTVEGQLDVPLLSKRYAGTGGPEGPATLRGTLKPRAHGECLTVAPVQVDPALLVYQVHGYGPVESIPAVYEYAQALAPALADVTTWADLVGYTLKPGQWISCRALGMFRLGGRPDKKLAADVIGGAVNGVAPLKAGAIVGQLLEDAGVSPQRIGSMDALDFTWSFYATDQVTVADMVKKAALDCGGYVFPDRLGNWQCGRYPDVRASEPLRADRTAEPLVQSISELNVVDPAWKVEVSYDRCWNVHNQDSDVSPALIDLEGLLLAEDGLLSDLREQAEQAAADAAFARAEIDAMIADGVLDRSDKRRAIDDIERERVIHDQLEGLYLAYEVNAEWGDYDADYDALIAYMTGLVPSIYDNTAVTPVDRATYLLRWGNFYNAKQVLLNAITDRTNEPTPWGDVVDDGKKPEDNATVGAPPGTVVNDRPAEDVTGAIDKHGAAIKVIPDLVTNKITERTDALVALNMDYDTIVLKQSIALADGNSVAISELRTYVDDKGAIVSEDMLQLTSRMGDAEAGLLQLNQTYADDKYASTKQFADLVARFDNNEAGFVLFTEAYADETKSTAETIRQLRTDVNGHTTAIQDSDKAFSDFEKATVERFSGIETDVDDAQTAIRDWEKTYNDSELATSERIEELGSKIDDERGERESAIRTVEKSVTDLDGTMSQRLDTISSEIDAPGTGIRAVIQTIQQTETDNNGARAEEIRNLQTEVGGYTSSIQRIDGTVASMDGKLRTSSVLKLQQDGPNGLVVAGGGIAIEDGVSSVSWLADGFRILANYGGAPKQVFYADQGGVFLDTLTVKDGSFGTLKLAGGAVTIKHVLTAGDTYVAANTAVNVFETGWLTIGDGVFGTATVDVEFTLDGTLGYDTACRFFLFVDTGSGFGNAVSTKTIGVSTGNGNTYFRMDGSMSYIVDGAQIRVALRANPAGWLPQSVARNVWVRDIGIAVDGAKR